MQVVKKQLKHTLALIFVSSLFSTTSAIAGRTDMEAKENYLKARATSHQSEMDHSAHAAPVDKSLEFHGVFYGYVPCNDCPGIKTTLSLKQNNNYLLVTQPARESSREFYEKGKYTWNEETHLVVLTPRKGVADPTMKQYLIEDEGGALVQLNEDGSRMVSTDIDRYVLRRSDAVKSREVHFH